VFDLERFIEDCRASLASDRPQAAIRELVARAVSDPARLVCALGEPEHAGIGTLYASKDLTILNIVWAPMMTVTPHDHRMWAVIGVYGGREDNIFWRRIPGDPDRRVEAAGARALSTGDVERRPWHHPFGDESHPAALGCAADLWRRFLRRRAERMGRRDAAGGAL